MSSIGETYSGIRAQIDDSDDWRSGGDWKKTPEKPRAKPRISELRALVDDINNAPFKRRERLMKRIPHREGVEYFFSQADDGKSEWCYRDGDDKLTRVVIMRYQRPSSDEYVTYPLTVPREKYVEEDLDDDRLEGQKEELHKKHKNGSLTAKKKRIS